MKLAELQKRITQGNLQPTNTGKCSLMSETNRMVVSTTAYQNIDDAGKFDVEDLANAVYITHMWHCFPKLVVALNNLLNASSVDVQVDAIRCAKAELAEALEVPDIYYYFTRHNPD